MAAAFWTSPRGHYGRRSSLGDVRFGSEAAIRRSFPLAPIAYGAMEVRSPSAHGIDRGLDPDEISEREKDS